MGSGAVIVRLTGPTARFMHGESFIGAHTSTKFDSSV